MEASTKSGVAAFNCPNCGASVPPDTPACSYCGSSISTRVCPACFGAVSVGMRHCPHCGKEVTDSTNPKAGSLRCPRCEVGLSPLAVGDHALSSCPGCGGLWADKTAFQNICMHEEEQEAVLGFRPEPVNPASAQTNRPQRAYIPCPECGKLMNHKNFSGCSGVVLDWCRDHGSWFDRSELQQIVLFIRDGGLRKARTREQLRLKEREEDLRMQEFRMAALERRLDPASGGMPEPANKNDPLLQFLFKLFRE